MSWQPILGYFDGQKDLLDPDRYASARKPFGEATTLPALAYRSKAFADLEDEKIWTRTWVCIGPHVRIPSPGDLLPFTVGNHGIHIQRQADGSVQGYFNFAQHGGCRYVPRQCQTGKKTSCFYTSCGHSRDRDVVRAGPDGEETTEMYMYRGVNPLKLMPIHVETLGPLAFVNVDFEPKVRSLNSTEEMDVLAQHLTAKAQHAGRFTMEVKSNWKLSGAAFLSQGSNACVGSKTARRFWCYPNLLVDIHEEYVVSCVLQPTSLTTTMHYCDVFVRDNVAAQIDIESMINALKHARAADAELAETLQMQRAGQDNPSPFLPQPNAEHAPPQETNPLMWHFHQQLIEDLLTEHEYVERPLYSSPGRSLNAGVNSGAM